MNSDLDYILEAWHGFFQWKPKFEINTSSESIENIDFHVLRIALDENLKVFKFKGVKSNFKNVKVKNIFFWKKRNLNINRSIILIEFKDTIKLNDLVSFVHEIKLLLGKETGYIPFINEVGMQIIVIADNIILEKTKKPVDTINNFKAIIQSFFIIDKANKLYYKSITWGQTISAKFQDLIDKVIKEKINSL